MLSVCLQVWDGAEKDPEYRSAMDLLNPDAMVSDLIPYTHTYSVMQWLDLAAMTSVAAPTTYCMFHVHDRAVQAARGRGGIVTSTEHTASERAAMKQARDHKEKVEKNEAKKKVIFKLPLLLSLMLPSCDPISGAELLTLSG